jgi:hypothetical protein
MGLLFGDTYVVNKTVSAPSNEDLADATFELAEATRKVAKANQNIANAINDERVSISHKRYSELLNKRKLLQSIKNEITTRISILCTVVNSSEYREGYMETYFMDPHKKIRMFKNDLKKGLCVGMNYGDKTAYLYKFSEGKEINYFDYKTVEDLGYEIVLFKTPMYVVETEGSAEVSGKEYQSLLSDETLLDTIYLPGVEVLPKVMFELLNVDSTSYIPQDPTVYNGKHNNGRFREFASYIKNNPYSDSDRFVCNSNGFIWDLNYGKTITLKHSY